MNTEEEIEQVKKVFLSLGAEEPQAAVMAKQLCKRADQWVEERGLERLEAIRQLMEMVVAGRSGFVPPSGNPSGNDPSEGGPA